MPPFQEILPIPKQQNSQNVSLDQYEFNVWVSGCHGILHDLSLIVAALLFVIYLAYHAKKNYLKLFNGRSFIMIVYYCCVWLVSLLNLFWCSVQQWECSAGKELTWNILSMFTTSGMLFLEVSLLAFLFKGNYAGGLDALTKTFIVSGLIVGLDVILKAIYIFGFGVPFYIESSEFSRVKWYLWVIHKLVLTAVYGFIFFLYYSKWREQLPARPAFYKYITVMFIFNVLALFACVLCGSSISFGFWLYSVTIACYHALYLPLLYITFLADFFQEEGLRLEDVYYSELKDAGFFDEDWD